VNIGKLGSASANAAPAASAAIAADIKVHFILASSVNYYY
jgi:hypothetical protein